MKKSTQVLVFFLLFGLWRLSYASDWQISVAGGFGQASDPAESFSTSQADLTVDSVLHLVANQHQSRDSDGANLYTEYFFAMNSITAEVTGTSNYTTSIDAMHLQLGGVYEWTNSDFVRPYFALTLGVSQYTPQLTGDEAFFSGTAGLGAKLRLTDFLALRVEARALGTLLNSSSSIFCSSDDSCDLGVEGTLWLQQHYTAGVTWSF